MERYGQSLEEFLTENNTNNTNNTTDDTDNTEEIETSDEESGFHTPDSVCVAQEVVKKCAGQCVSFFFYGRNWVLPGPPREVLITPKTKGWCQDRKELGREYWDPG